MNADELIQHITEFAKAMEQFNPAVAELQKQESEYDQQQSIMLHQLEVDKLDACGLVKLAKGIKELRKKRRVVKDNLAAFSSFNDRFYKTNKGLSMSLLKTANAMKGAGWDGRIYED